MLKEGDLVTVRKHKCGVDVIGPFASVIEFIEDGVANVTDPEGREWGVKLRHLTKRALDGCPRHAFWKETTKYSMCPDCGFWLGNRQ